MNKYQFRMIAAILWLIASNTADDVFIALGGSVFFAAFAIGSLFAIVEFGKGDPHA